MTGWLEDDIDSSTSLPNQDLKEESNSAEVELIRKTGAKKQPKKKEADTSIEALSVTPRPWLIEEKLDPKFVEWLAQKWSVKYGDNLHTARSNVLRHFKKDELHIIIAWTEYSAEYLDRYKNTQTRLARGIGIKEDEQKRLIDNVGALTRPLPEELSPVASDKAVSFTPRTKTLQSSSESDRTTQNKPSIDWDKLPTDEEKPENFAAYQEWQPEKIEKPATLRQIQEFLKSFGKKSSL